MHRFSATKMLLEHVGDLPVVANLGPSSDELWHAGHRERSFYTYGSMGLCSSMALGMALSTDEKVVSLDGDGSLLMNLGSLGTIARQSPANLVHIVFDNKQWAETGGQPTHTAAKTDLAEVARGSGIEHVAKVATLEAFEDALDKAIAEDGPWCIVVDVEEADHGPRPLVRVEENLLRFRRTFPNA